MSDPKIAWPHVVDFNPEYFFVPAHKTLFREIKRMIAENQAIDVLTVHQWLRDRGLDEEVGSPVFLSELHGVHAVPLNVKAYALTVKEKFKARFALESCERAASDLRADTAEPVKIIEWLNGRTSGLLGSTDINPLEQLDATAFDVNNPPPRANPMLWIAGQPVATPGNLVALQSQAKGGKTALITGMLASLMQPAGDCLSVEGDNSNGGAVIHFDTEQSPYDHHCVVRLALRRAGIDAPPAWFHSYNLVSIPTAQRFNSIVAELDRRKVERGAVTAVFIDGAVDLITDPNDTPQALSMVEQLHSLAVKHSCTIVCVIHENPGDDGRGKTRGHFGSQLERKAETNIRLDKCKDGISTVYFDKARHGFLSKDKGPRFMWSDDAKMHVSTDTASKQRDDFKTAKLVTGIKAVFSKTKAFTYSELWMAIQPEFDCKERTAKGLITESMNAGIIRKNRKTRAIMNLQSDLVQGCKSVQNECKCTGRMCKCNSASAFIEGAAPCTALLGTSGERECKPQYGEKYIIEPVSRNGEICALVEDLAQARDFKRMLGSLQAPIHN